MVLGFGWGGVGMERCGDVCRMQVAWSWEGAGMVLGFGWGELGWRGVGICVGCNWDGVGMWLGWSWGGVGMELGWRGVGVCSMQLGWTWAALTQARLLKMAAGRQRSGLSARQLADGLSADLAALGRSFAFSFKRNFGTLKIISICIYIYIYMAI